MERPLTVGELALATASRQKPFATSSRWRSALATAQRPGYGLLLILMSIGSWSRSRGHTAASWTAFLRSPGRLELSPNGCAFHGLPRADAAATWRARTNHLIRQEEERRGEWSGGARSCLQITTNLNFVLTSTGISRGAVPFGDPVHEAGLGRPPAGRGRKPAVRWQGGAQASASTKYTLSNIVGIARAAVASMMKPGCLRRRRTAARSHRSCVPAPGRAAPAPPLPSAPVVHQVNPEVAGASRYTCASATEGHGWHRRDTGHGGGRARGPGEFEALRSQLDRQIGDPGHVAAAGRLWTSRVLPDPRPRRNNLDLVRRALRRLGWQGGRHKEEIHAGAHQVVRSRRQAGMLALCEANADHEILALAIAQGHQPVAEPRHVGRGAPESVSAPIRTGRSRAAASGLRAAPQTQQHEDERQRPQPVMSAPMPRL